MLFTRLEPHHISWTDLLDWPAIALHPAVTERHDENLTQWMRVPGSARAGLERDGVAGRARRWRYREQRINSHRASKPLARSLPRRLRAASLDLHSYLRSWITRRTMLHGNQRAKLRRFGNSHAPRHFD